MYSAETCAYEHAGKMQGKCSIVVELQAIIPPPIIYARMLHKIDNSAISDKMRRMETLVSIHLPNCCQAVAVVDSAASLVVSGFIPEAMNTAVCMHRLFDISILNLKLACSHRERVENIQHEVVALAKSLPHYA